MIFEPAPLAGLAVVKPERHADGRGHFARLWCAQEFGEAGFPFAPAQISISHNALAGTLRGLHWQAAPHAETKLVSVNRGRVFDVAVDLREGSPTRLRWFGLELDAEAGEALLIPPGFAHGFVTLTDDADVLYLIDTPHAPEAARGARHDDPAFGIAWPRPPAVISERDRAWPLIGAAGRGP